MSAGKCTSCYKKQKKPLKVEWWIIKLIDKEWNPWDQVDTEKEGLECLNEMYRSDDDKTLEKDFKLCKISYVLVKEKKNAK